MPLTVAELQNIIDCRCSYFSEAEFRAYVLQLLANIAETSAAAGGGGGIVFPPVVPVAPLVTDVTWLPMTRVAFGAITGTYVVALNDTNNKLYISINNNTNQTVLVSFNGTNDHLELLPNANYKLEPGELRQIDTPVYLKHAGVAPTLGDVTIGAFY